MKTSITNMDLNAAGPSRKSSRLTIWAFLLGAAVLWAMPGSVRAQNLYVGQPGGVSAYSVATGAPSSGFTEIPASYAYQLAASVNTLFVPSYVGQTVGEYNATTGAAISANFITASYPTAIALSGNSLWVLSFGGTINEYNATTGALMTGSSIVPPSCSVSALAFSGDNLLVACFDSAISEWNTTTGVEINPTFITGLGDPIAVAESGNDLYVLDGSGAVGVYNLTTGAPINANLITGLSAPSGLAVSGGDLFVGNVTLGTVGEYSATTGAVIHESFIAGVSPLSLLVNGPAQNPPCTLTDSVTYNATDSTLTMKFTVGNKETSAVTWSAWLTYQDTITPVFSPVSQPVTNPPKNIQVTFPDLAPEGVVGVLSTLTTATGGVVCSNLATANTGTP